MDIGIDNYLHKKFKKVLNLEHHQFHHQQQQQKNNEKENSSNRRVIIDEEKSKDETSFTATETKKCCITISETNIMSNIHNNNNNDCSNSSKIINTVPNQSTNSVTVVNGPPSTRVTEIATQSSISPANNNNNNNSNGNTNFSNSCISYVVNSKSSNDQNEEKYANGIDENLKEKMTKISCSNVSNCTSSIIKSNSSYQINNHQLIVNKVQQCQDASTSNGPLLLQEQMMDTTTTTTCSSSDETHQKHFATAAATTATATTTTTTTTTIDKNPSGKYICGYCNLACSKPSVLEKHIRAHTNERPFPCESCGFRFKTRSNLYKHRRSRAHANRVMGNKAAQEETNRDPSTATAAAADTGAVVSKQNMSAQIVNSSSISNSSSSSSTQGHDKIALYNRNKPYKPRFHSSSLLVKQFIDVDDTEDVRHTSFRGTDLSHHISQIISKNNSIINSNDPNLMIKKRYFDRSGTDEFGEMKTKNDSHHHHHGNADEPLNLTNKNRKRCFSELGEPVMQKSLIKELLLKNLSSDMQCPYCKMIFQTVTELELHKMRSCKGKPSPDNARYTRSSSVNVASILTKNKNAFDSMPLFQNRLFPMSSPGPFLGKTRLVDSDKSKSFSFDAVNIPGSSSTAQSSSAATSSSNSSINELSTIGYGTTTTTITAPAAALSSGTSSSSSVQKEERRNVKLFGGEVKVHSATGETTSYKIDNVDDNKAMDTDGDYNEYCGGKISENCVIKSRLQTGGTVLTNKTTKEETKMNYSDIIRVYENTAVSPNIDYAGIGKPYYQHQSDVVTTSCNERNDSIISSTLGGSGTTTDSNNSTLQKYTNITDFSQNAIKLMTPNIRQPTVCLTGLISRSSPYYSEANLISTTAARIQPSPSNQHSRLIDNNNKQMDICVSSAAAATSASTFINSSSNHPINLAVNDKTIDRTSAGLTTRRVSSIINEEATNLDILYDQQRAEKNESSSSSLFIRTISDKQESRCNNNNNNNTGMNHFVLVDKLMDRKAIMKMDGIEEETMSETVIPNYSICTSTSPIPKSLTIHQSNKSKNYEVQLMVDAAGVPSSVHMATCVDHQNDGEVRKDRLQDTTIETSKYYTSIRNDQGCDGRFICEQCGIRCTKPAMLRKHMKIHSNERPFSCDSCNINFKTKENLAKHLQGQMHSKHYLTDSNAIDLNGHSAYLLSSENSSGTDSDGRHSDGYDTDDDDNKDDDDDDNDSVYPDESRTRQQEHEAAYGLLSLSQKTGTGPSSLMPITITSDIFSPSSGTLMIRNETGSSVSSPSSVIAAVNNNNNTAADHIMTTEEIAYVTKMNYAKNKVLASLNMKECKSPSGSSSSSSWWSPAVSPSQIVIETTNIATTISLSNSTCASTSPTICTNKEISKDKENLLTYLGKSLIRPLTYPYTSSTMNLNHNSTIGETNRTKSIEHQQKHDESNKRRTSISLIEKPIITTTTTTSKDRSNELLLVDYPQQESEENTNRIHNRLTVSTPTPTTTTTTEYTNKSFNDDDIDDRTSSIHSTLPSYNHKVDIENSDCPKVNYISNSVPTIKLNDVPIQDNSNSISDRKRKFIDTTNNNSDYQNKLLKNNDEVMDLSMSTASKDGISNGNSLFGQMQNTVETYGSNSLCRISPFNKIVQPIVNVDENNRVFLHTPTATASQQLLIHPVKMNATANRGDCLFLLNRDTTTSKSATIEYDNSAMETLADVATKRVKLEENSLAKSVATEYLKLATQKDGGLDGNGERTTAFLASINSKDVSDLLVKSEGNENCSVCFKSFKPSQLKIHMNIHFLGRQFRCDTCSVSFRKLGHLKKHENSASHHHKLSSPAPMQSTSEPRPFKCSDCAVAFRIQGHLAKHLRSKLHILKLECLSKIPFGLYTELERSNSLLTEINTIDAEQCLESLKSLAKKVFANESNQQQHQSTVASSSPNDHIDSGKNIKLSDS